MNNDDPVELRLEALRSASEDLAPAVGFNDLVLSRIQHARRSPWLALAVATAAALASFAFASFSDARLAEQVLAVGDEVSVEAP